MTEEPRQLRHGYPQPVMVAVETIKVTTRGWASTCLPFEASEMVRAIAGGGELVRLPGDGHLLANSGTAIWDRLETWLPDALQL